MMRPPGGRYFIILPGRSWRGGGMAGFGTSGPDTLNLNFSTSHDMPCYLSMPFVVPNRPILVLALALGQTGPLRFCQVASLDEMAEH